MTMATVYLGTMIVAWLIGHFGVNNRYRCKPITLLSLLTIFTMIFIISGFRTGIGDTYFYKHMYKIIGSKMAVQPMWEILAKDKMEKGFTFLIMLLNLNSSNPQSLVIVCALITNLLNLYNIYKYARPFELGIYLYFATVIFYVTMNGIRQALVASIFFFCIRFILKKQWKPYMLVMAFLCSIHTSAIFLIPVYFIARYEAWGKQFWKGCLIGLGIFMIFPIIKPILVLFLEDTKYSVYGKQIAAGGESVSIIRVAVMFVPLVLAYSMKEELKRKWEYSSLFIIMSALNAFFIVLGIQYLYFYRMCIYFEIFNLALIPQIINCMEKRKAQYIYVYLIVFYFIFAYYQVAICWKERFSNLLFG